MTAAAVHAPVREAVEAAVAALEAAGCETPRLDAEVLIADALGIDRGGLISDPRRPVGGAHAREIGQRIRRRVAREPVAYILGRQGFRYIDLAVDHRVLIPRPETELLVEVALTLPEAARVHDVGTGSGAIALALASERPDLVVSASDASADAVQLARANARALGLEVPIEVVRGLPAGRFDLVLANLPYVAERDRATLAADVVRFEPADALFAGSDGLDMIRALIDQAPPGTALALEHGADQGEEVRALLGAAHTRRDLAGHERVTTGTAR